MTLNKRAPAWVQAGVLLSGRARRGPRRNVKVFTIELDVKLFRSVPPQARAPSAPVRRRSVPNCPLW